MIIEFLGYSALTIFMCCVVFAPGYFILISEVLPYPLHYIQNVVLRLVARHRYEYIKDGNHSETFCSECGRRLCIKYISDSKFDTITGKRKTEVSKIIICPMGCREIEEIQ